MTTRTAKKLTPEQQLAIIRKAWGNQRGYCFFPWIDGTASDRETRIKSYHEGQAFPWPKEKDKVLEHMRAHTNDDLYWCPSLFEKRARRLEFAMDEHCLWADLDEADPREIDDYPPTIAWETSPGRFQALWLIQGGLMGASWQGNENHRLTYYLSADPSGWDTTQLLRLPGAVNHKFEYWNENAGEAGAGVPGKLLWSDGRRYQADDFTDLPEVQSASAIQNILEDEVLRVDRHEVWGRVRLRVSKRVRDLVSARETAGDRSSALWEIERELADAGCTVTEIVAIVRGTVWNKYGGRQDELKRLTIEASKAVGERSEESKEALELELEKYADAVDLFDFLAGVKQPDWVVHQILSEASCGFIAGQPKQYKSWVALDLALSVATGLPFLNHFSIRKPGPVLYIQEEDSAAMLKQRISKMWPGKQADKVKLGKNGEIEWHPADPQDRPDISVVVRGGVVLSDSSWQGWLDEQLAKGWNGQPYRLLLIDPLMMVAGEVDENRSQEMTTKLFKPLKQLCDKHQVCIQIVHHMKKIDPAKGGLRGGQQMLGSTANWAWAEDSLYLRFGKGGDVYVERESKHTPSGSFVVKGLRNKRWTPAVVDDRTDQGDDDDAGLGIIEDDRKPVRRATPQRGMPKLLTTLQESPLKARTTHALGLQLGISTSGVWKQLRRLEEADLATTKGKGWVLTKAGRDADASNLRELLHAEGQ